MNPVRKFLFMAGMLLLSCNIYSQITKSLYVQSPCAATLISDHKKNLSENDLMIFPNPNDGLFRIQFSKRLPDNELKITVINGSGAEVFDKKVELKDNYVEIDLRGNSRGIYMIRVISGRELILKKFIISF